MNLENDRAITLLEELLVWTKFTARPAILASWDAILSDDRHLLAYELSDGSRTQAQVAEATGLSQPTISNLWAKWRRLGIARPQGKTVIHIARPSDFGMDRAMRVVPMGFPKRLIAERVNTGSSLEESAADNES